MVFIANDGIALSQPQRWMYTFVILSHPVTRERYQSTVGGIYSICTDVLTCPMLIGVTFYHTETKGSFWRNFHHWLHWKLSKNDNFQCSQWWKFNQNEDVSDLIQWPYEKAVMIHEVVMSSERFLYYWHLWDESTFDRWIPLMKAQ